jgi:hypothetical protein
MNPLARNLSGARGSPNTYFGTRNTAQMNGRQIPYSVPTGPGAFQNGGARNYNSSNGNGNGNGNRQYNNRQYNNRQNTNGNGSNQYQNNNNSNGQGRNFNSNYRGKHFNPNFHGHQGGAVENTRTGNSNYKGKNFNPNYRWDVHSPQTGAALGNQREFVPNHQGVSVLSHRGGTVADARYGNQNNQFSGLMHGPQNNCRNRSRKSQYLPLPAKFNNAFRDIDILMTDAQSDESYDIEMPDAPPIPIDPVSNLHQATDMLHEILTSVQRIEAFTAGAQALQQTVSHPVLRSPLIAPNPLYHPWNGQNYAV